MNILDIDLDFFLNDRWINTTIQGQRLPSEEFLPWPVENVITFLEEKCGLTSQSPINGKLFIRHHELYNFIKDHQLDSINLYHIDAHNDMYQIEFSDGFSLIS